VNKLNTRIRDGVDDTDMLLLTSVSDTIRKPPIVKAQTAF